MNVPSLQRAIAAHADADRKAWWVRYLRGTADFRGVTMAQVRAEVAGWLARGDGPASTDGRVRASLELLRQPMTEDRLAGVLLLAEHVFPTGEIAAEALFPRLAVVFDEGHLADWNIVDWLSVKVLARWLEREGAPCAARLEGWARAPTLWRRRAAAVAFVPLAPRGDDVFPGLTDVLLAICARHVADPARFSQTSVGWSLRELSRAEPDRVRAFLDVHGDTLSREARRAAAKHL